VEKLEERANPIVVGGLGSSPDAIVDPNTATSEYAGVGSIEVLTKGASFIGTGTVIGKHYVLTAAHVVDLNNDGKVDRKDGVLGVYFVLNMDGDQSSKIAVSGYNISPDFTGFNHPSVNDDLAILTLAEDVPDGVPIYPLPKSDMKLGTEFTMVGYGRSGDGVRGYTTPSSPFVKRVGENKVDGFYGQDDAWQAPANETFRFDFDAPTRNGPLGGPTVGTNQEAQLGPGDSGAPAFVSDDGHLVVAGIATFTQGANAPKFGSKGGGVNLYPYESFINSVLDGTSTSSTTVSTRPPRSPGSGGVGVGANPLRNPIQNFPPPAPPPPAPPQPPTSQPPPQDPPPAPDPAPVVPPVPTPVDTPPPDPVPTPDPGPVIPIIPLPDPVIIDPIAGLGRDGGLILPDRIARSA
jgi:hypothetical protein